MSSICNFVHSLNNKTGGVFEASRLLNSEIRNFGINSFLSDNKDIRTEKVYLNIAHGLWQLPSELAYKNLISDNTPYLVFPHGMLDPWFKNTYHLKHIKKQLYWLWRQGRILKNAHAVCFTTEEERRLAQNTFWPYNCREVVTGLGVANPPPRENQQKMDFQKRFPEIMGKKILLYMGRIDPKKGLNLLFNAFFNEASSESILVIAGPIDPTDDYTKKLQALSREAGKKVLWTDMLEGDFKWGALRLADALILPSHQENYGMVVAEACSVGTPVFITNKVNLYREILEYDAGIVEDDTQAGVDNLVLGWVNRKHQNLPKNALRCFHEKLHISKTASNIMDLFNEIKETNPE